MIEQYLRRLSKALADVPAEASRELLEDVRGHIDEGLAAAPERSPEALQAILSRLGEPEALAAEERERLGLPATPPDRRPGLLEWAAIVLTAVLAPIGLILAWLSSRWRARDKAITTGIAFLGLVLLFALTFPALGAYSQVRVAAQATAGQPAAAGGAATPFVLALVAVALWGSSLAAAVLLALRLRPAPVRPLVLVPVALAVLACAVVMVVSFAPMAGPAARGPVPVRAEQVVPQP